MVTALDSPAEPPCGGLEAGTPTIFLTKTGYRNVVLIARVRFADPAFKMMTDGIVAMPRHQPSARDRPCRRRSAGAVARTAGKGGRHSCLSTDAARRPY